MSYDIQMKDPKTGETLHYEEPHEITGGTYALGGTTEVWLNITYNYSTFYYETLDSELGIRVLYGMTGREAAPLLRRAIRALGYRDTDEDYWKPTRANAGNALLGLLMFALDFPDGVFDGD